jgi:hypothetical protein
VDTGFPKRSCSNKKIEQDDDSKKSHPALGREPINSEWSADVLFGAHFGLKSDITALPKSAMKRLMQRSKLHPYSITSSARARSVGGTVSPMAPAQADQQVFYP